MSRWSRIARVFRPDSHQDEIREEIEFHLAMDQASGHDRREARLRLGNPARIREEVREAGIATWLESVLQDARYGLRQFRRSPALFIAIVLSLAIGVGANTAIFTLTDAVLLEPLPVDEPDALVLLEWRSEGLPAGIQRIGGRARTVEGGRLQASSVSEAVHRAFAAGQSEFASVIGFSGSIPMALSVGTGVPEQVRVQYVSVRSDAVPPRSDSLRHPRRIRFRSACRGGSPRGGVRGPGRAADGVSHPVGPDRS